MDFCEGNVNRFRLLFSWLDNWRDHNQSYFLIKSATGPTMREKCPQCPEGFLYKREDGKFTIKSCFKCGYYWNDSEGYDDLSKRLFVECFPKQTKWRPSPEIDRRFLSPEELTQPIKVPPPRPIYTGIDQVAIACKAA